MNYMLIEKKIGSLPQRRVSEFLAGLLVLATKDKNGPTTQSFFTSLVTEGNGQDTNTYNITDHIIMGSYGHYLILSNKTSD